MKLDFSKRITVPENVMMRELDGESVLLNLDLGIYFGLDDIGTNFWTLLVESKSIQAAFDQLSGEYEIESDQLSSDLAELVHQLVDNGLLTLKSGVDT